MLTRTTTKEHRTTKDEQRTTNNEGRTTDYAPWNLRYFVRTVNWSFRVFLGKERNCTTTCCRAIDFASSCRLLCRYATNSKTEEESTGRSTCENEKSTATALSEIAVQYWYLVIYISLQILPLSEMYGMYFIFPWPDVLLHGKLSLLLWIVYMK